jgi:hypothetical protein
MKSVPKSYRPTFVYTASGIGGKQFYFSTKSHGIVTGRDFGINDGVNRYHPELRELVEKAPPIQVVEIGPGLGEFVPTVAQSKMPMPIAIDVINYEDLLKEMTQYLPQIEDDKTAYEELTELIRRCKIMLDPSKVKLINFCLEDAIVRHPELIDSADILVDLLGAFAYPKNWANFGSHKNSKERFVQAQNRVLGMEIAILKESGRHCLYSQWYDKKELRRFYNEF